MQCFASFFTKPVQNIRTAVLTQIINGCFCRTDILEISRLKRRTQLGLDKKIYINYVDKDKLTMLLYLRYCYKCNQKVVVVVDGINQRFYTDFIFNNVF